MNYDFEYRGGSFVKSTMPAVSYEVERQPDGKDLVVALSAYDPKEDQYFDRVVIARDTPDSAIEMADGFNERKLSIDEAKEEVEEWFGIDFSPKGFGSPDQ